jgi:uncharacterized protein YceK
MKRHKLIISVYLVCLIALAGCATVNVLSPNRAYYEAQQAFFNAWETYHKAWVALPDTDPRKAEWVDKYHPVFLDAAILLNAWGQEPNDQAQGDAVDLIMDKLENILIELAIKKGVA